MGSFYLQFAMLNIKNLQI